MNARHLSGNDATTGFTRFLCVGGSATALQYLLLFALVAQVRLPSVVASSLAYAISTLYNYILSRAFTFRSSRAHASALPRFILVSTVGLGLNAVVVWLSIDQLQLHYLLAQVLATLVTLGWNFTAGRNWAFAN